MSNASPALKPESNKPIYEQMGNAAGESVCDLITQHWPAIQAIGELTHKKVPVSVTLKFSKVAEETFKVETSIRFAEKHADEREAIIGADPKQEKINYGANS